MFLDVNCQLQHDLLLSLESDLPDHFKVYQDEILAIEAALV